MAVNTPSIETPKASFESSGKKVETGSSARNEQQDSRQEQFSTDAKRAQEQNQGFLDMVKVRAEDGSVRYELADEGPKIAEELEGINESINKLSSDYNAERNELLGLPAGPKLEQLAPLHPAIIEKPVEAVRKPEIPIPDPKEEAVFATLRQADYQVNSEADLAKVPEKETSRLSSHAEKSMVLAEKMLVILDQINPQNRTEVGEFVQNKYKVVEMPLIEEEEDIFSLFAIIKLLVEGQAKYMLLVQPEYYNRTNEKGEPEAADAIQNLAAELSADIMVVPEEESKAVAGNILQLKDGTTLMSANAPRTRNLLEAGVGPGKLKALPPPSEGFNPKLSSLPIRSASPSVPSKLG